MFRSLLTPEITEDEGKSFAKRPGSSEKFLFHKATALYTCIMLRYVTQEI